MFNLSKPLTEGYSFSSKNFVNGGWNLFNQQMGSFVGITLLFFIIQFIVSTIPFVNLISNVIQYILYAGFFIYCRNIKLGNPKAGDFFKGFNYFGNIFMYLVLLFLFFVPAFILLFTKIIPFEFVWELATSGFADIEYIGEAFRTHILGNLTSLFWIYLLLFGMMIYLYTSYIFVLPLIVDAKLGFWEAMELSRKTVGKKFFNFLIFWIIVGIVSVAAIVMTCGVGTLLVIPVIYCIIFEMYDHIYGAPDEIAEAELQ